MTSTSHTLNTPLGAFVISLSCEGVRSEDVAVDLQRVAPVLQLPPTMSVAACNAFVVRVRSTKSVPLLQWTCTCLADVRGYPETGEALDAQEWAAGGHVVMVGTEDSEFLARRLPFLQQNPYESVVHYAPDRIEVRLHQVPAEFDLSLHFVIAENPWPEPMHLSAWVAVDIPHARLIAMMR